jgi:predicted TIM-barrel fold metal-dependent hydrolase
MGEDDMSDARVLAGVRRLAYDGAIDADGHILEPPDLWERYLDPKFRDRALRIVRDADGLEELEIGGRRSTVTAKGMPSLLGVMGAPDLMSIARDPERTYVSEAAYGSFDPSERLHLLDAEGLDAVVLYPTLGLLWEAELEDPELSQAYTRAYNRWICEFCSDSGDRLVPTAHLSLSDPEAAATELERAVAEGARGCFVLPFTHARRALAHAAHNRVFAAAQDLDVVFAIHPGFEPDWVKGERFTGGNWTEDRLQLLESVRGGDGVRHQLATFFDMAVFDQFPRLKVLVLESGGGWVGHFLDRMDAVYAHTPIGVGMSLKEKPSTYFQDRCWVSCDPDEHSLAPLIERYGPTQFLWASDYPHADHTPDYLVDLEMLARELPDENRNRFLGENVRELFKIEGHARA